jgi:hypothetical protein
MPVFKGILAELIKQSYLQTMKEFWYNCRFWGGPPLIFALNRDFKPIELPENDEQCLAEQLYIEACIELGEINE